MWWQELTSPAFRWLYGLILLYGILPLSRWWSNNSKEKAELKEKVDKLEDQIHSVGDKLDTEIEARRTMEDKLDKQHDKIDGKFDKLSDVLQQVVINTAVNAEKLKK